MDNSSQLLNSLAGGSSSSSISQTLSNLQPLLTAGLVVSTILTILFCVYFVVGYIHKWKVQSAILRIDKNLQKLVDFQIGPDKPVPIEVVDVKEKPLDPIDTAEEPVEVSGESEENTSEQN